MDTALFSPSSLFRDEDDEGREMEEGDMQRHQQFIERTHVFPGLDLNSGKMIGNAKMCSGLYILKDGDLSEQQTHKVLSIREFSFHQFNANLLWPGTFAFCEWLSQNQSILKGKRILELGSGTGALAIYMQKTFGIDITTSDFDDKEVEENIAHNCIANGIKVLPHVRHTWGEAFPVPEPDWDFIVASDILLYVKEYPNLIKTLYFLLKSYKQGTKNALPGSSQHTRIVTVSGEELELQQPLFLMSWRRRIGGDEALFFSGCEDAGLAVKHIGSRVYYISPRRDA